MTESVTITEVSEKAGYSKISYLYVTATDGTATGETLGDYTGRILYVISDPGATAPTEGWDFQIQNEDNYDLIKGAGTDRSASITEYLQGETDGLGCAVREKLTLEVENGGNTKGGTVVVYIVK